VTTQPNPTFSSAAHWIWGGDQPTPKNDWRYFRKTCDIPAGITRAALLLTADSSYELHVNGAFVGRGPVRGFPFAYFYDVYDVTPLLQPGANTLAILARHLGDHTMTYVKGAPGLLAELVVQTAAGETISIASGSDWRTIHCDAFNAAATRISVQLGFEEQYDARREHTGWQGPGFDDHTWSPATIVGPVGCSPWTSLSPSTIPFLTENAVPGVEVKAVELARPRQGVIWNLDVRELANTDRTGLRSAPYGERGWLIATEIHVTNPCTLQVYLFPNYEQIDFRINDYRHDRSAVVDGQYGPFAVELHAGPNLCLIRNAEWPSLLFACDQPLTFSAGTRASENDEHAAWLFVGPMNEFSAEFAAAWDVTELAALPTDAPRAPIPAAANQLDIFALTASQEFYAVAGGFCTHEITRATPRPLLPGVRQLVDAPQALLADTGEWTTIYPQPDGDVHLVIDFGKEMIGYFEFDLDAPEGAILDGSGFEGLDDGGIFWTMNTRNSFRYVCRAGRQVFRSHERRGFRYLSLTLRVFDRPIRIRHISNYLATYPVAEVGHFACSDETLTKIWEVGAYTVRLCMLDTYVDCPTYEQVYWVGDARNSALVNAVAFGAFDLSDRCVRLTGQSLSPELKRVKPPYLEAMRTHMTTSHVVSGWFDEIPMWNFLWVWMAWETYLLTGNRGALADYYVDVRECLRRCEGFLSPRDLLDVPEVWNLVDWAAQDLERDGEVISNTVLMAQALDCAAEMAQTLAKPDEAAAHRELAARLRAAVNLYGWSDEYQGYVDTVRDAAGYTTFKARREAAGVPVEAYADYLKKIRISEPTNTLALLCRSVPAARVDAVMRYVLAAKEGKFIGSSPWMARFGKTEEIVPVGSPWFLFFTLETLFQVGHDEDALQLLREQWNRMLEKGATTFWETFPGHIGGGHWSRSLCHGWSAAPAYFLSTKVLGVTPAAPGYSRVRIAPQPWNLRWARGVVPTPHGPVSVAWHIDDAGKFQIEYHAPASCTVEVVTP
jgi:hypothetical protein